MSKTTTNETHREVTMIALDDKLQGYPEVANPFKPYTGKQLERLTDSIKVNGVIHPIIVQLMPDGTYRIISGHSRVNAAKAAGLTEMPAIVRKDLTDDQAELLVIESNIEQRTFSNFLPSERVKSIHQYHAKVSKPGFRSDLKIADTSDPLDQMLTARQATAKAYGVGTGIIQRYTQLYKLSDPLMERLDKNEFGINPATNLANIREEVREATHEQIEAVLAEASEKMPYKITMANSGELKKHFQTAPVSSAADKKAAKEKIKEILTQTDASNEETSDDTVKIPIPAEKYAELFPDNPEPKQEVVEYTIGAIEQRRNQEVG